MSDQMTPSQTLGQLNSEILGLISIAHREIGDTETNFAEYRRQWERVSTMASSLNGEAGQIVTNASGEQWRNKMAGLLKRVQPDATKWPPADKHLDALRAFELEKLPVEDDPLLTPEAVGRKINKTGATVRKWIRDGLLTGIRYPSGLGRHSFGVRTSEVNKMLESSAMDKQV